MVSPISTICLAKNVRHTHGHKLRWHSVMTSVVTVVCVVFLLRSIPVRYVSVWYNVADKPLSTLKVQYLPSS